MPKYDYHCRECGAVFEIRMSMSEYSSEARPACPSCGAENSERSFTSVGVLTGSRGGGGSVPSGGGGCCHSGFS